MTTGPLTYDDLRALWQDVTDDAYWRPMTETPDGTVPIDQAIEQTLELSRAIDKTTQAMYIFPWSGQTAAPASGAAYAMTVLTLARTARIDRAIVFEVGQIILHVTEDYGENGAQTVQTGLRYRVAQRAVFLPGDPGPLDVLVTAEMPGSGYNQPQPGTIRQIQQIGTGLSNTGAWVNDGANSLRLTNGSGEILDPSHVLGYVKIVAGSNVGEIRQIRGYQSGAPPVVQLDRYQVMRGTSIGSWLPGEVAYQSATQQYGYVVTANADYLMIDVPPGQTVVWSAGALYGNQSGASFTASAAPLQDASLTGASATWQFLDWAQDLGVTVTNTEQPDGGAVPVLDEIGYERNIRRSPGETDDQYRPRVGTPADVVAPNAIRRAANHALRPYGAACCYRQVGSPLLRGMFYDAGSSANVPQNPKVNFAYDLPQVPQNRFKVAFDLAHYRGWFLVGIPRFNLGEYGGAYSRGPRMAYDVPVRRGNFYGGRPVGNRVPQGAVWAAVERARMGGVFWDLYIEDIGCF